jgi:hypothetical protein
MNILTAIIFIFISYGLGLFVSKRNTAITNMAIGLATIPVLGLMLNILHIPIDWRIFLGIALINSISHFIQWLRTGRKFPKITLTRQSWQTLTVLVIFLFALAVYCWGPFQYPWLENDDSWSHAASIKYVAVEKNLDAPDGLFQYLNPYPPGYSIVIGLIHQINPSLYWSLKFFNGLIICLGFLFFYIFAEEFTQNKTKAAFATFLLAVIPCYLTHFIWSHALVVTLFFPGFYFLIRALKEKQFVLPSSIACAAITLTQPTQAIKFAIMAIFLILSYIPSKIRWKNIGLVIIISGILSLLWWGPIITSTLQNRSKIAVRDDRRISASIADTESVVKDLFSPTGGTATRAYTWEDYFFISERTYINNPLGLGPIVSLMAILGLLFSLIALFRKQDSSYKAYLCTILFWLIFTFLGMNSMTFQLPIGLFAFRFWMLFAIPIVFLCTEAFYLIQNFIQFKPRKILFITLVVVTILSVNLPSKWRLNTRPWHYGVHWASDSDILGYTWMRKRFPANTKVFAFTDNILVLGHDMRADFWTNQYKEFIDSAFEDNLDTLYQNLQAQNFDFVVVSPRDVWKFGIENVNEKIISLDNDSRFELVYNNPSVKIFQIVQTD